MSSGPTGPVIWPADAHAALSDPETTGETLALIAAQYPGLRDQVAQHRHAYPALQQWISQLPAEASTSASAPASGPSAGSPLRWVLLAVGVLVVVAAVVVALLWWSPWSAPAATPSATARPSSNVTTSASPRPTTPIALPSPSTALEAQTSAYRGSATQNSTAAKVWDLSLTISDNYGLVDYTLPGSGKTCRGVLIRGANGAWLERITEGACDDKGNWTFAGVGTDRLTGTYRPAHGSYRVTATLKLTSHPAPTVVNSKVPTEGCNYDPPKQISTVVVMDGSVIALIDHGSGGLATYRGPRDAPTDYLSIVGEDDNVNVAFTTSTSSDAIVVTDC